MEELIRCLECRKEKPPEKIMFRTSGAAICKDCWKEKYGKVVK